MKHVESCNITDGKFITPTKTSLKLCCLYLFLVIAKMITMIDNSRLDTYHY